MGYWSRAAVNSITHTVPHWQGKSKRAIASTVFKTVFIYVIALILVRFRHGIEQMIEESGIILDFIIATGAVLFAIFLWNLFTAPSRMERDAQTSYQQEVAGLSGELQGAKSRLKLLEEERIPKIVAEPIMGKKGRYESVRYTTWAELKVKNTSAIRLENVSVQIVELVQVYEKQDEQGVGTGIYHLHEPYPQWSPANVYWSERTTVANQFTIPISPNESQYALIAFHHEHGSGIGVLNTPTHPPMLESRIIIEVSSPNMTTWRGAYYIEYRPPSTDKLEFVEWDSWCKSHKVIERSTPDK